MRLLNSMGPNPRMVRMFMIEKGIELELLEHDILGAENYGKHIQRVPVLGGVGTVQRPDALSTGGC